MDPRGRVNPDPRSTLPAVDRLSHGACDLRPGLPRWAAVAAARQLIDAARVELEQGGVEHVGSHPERDWLAETVAAAEELVRPTPFPVINATGVVLHTNLGRARLAPGAAAAAAAVGASYSDLELDLASGKRGNRLALVNEKIRQLSGAEAVTACNNNAAAVLLALDSLARGREVVVSRGELVEIGGSFRVPDIMQRAGVRLVEVGTTNRTHARDYEQAIGSDTALLLKVHRSNFEQRGFVADVELPALAEIAARHGLPVVEDLGSGTLVDLRADGFPEDSFAPARLRQGANLVCFSGDKVLGGPQAGIVIGDEAIVDAMRRNPLARALRLDKLTLAALDWTITAMLEGRAREEIPVLRQLLASSASLEKRARDLATRLAAAAPGAVRFDVMLERAPVGGGSLPGFELESWTVEIRDSGRRPDALAASLRRAERPVLARVRDGALALDLRTVDESELGALEASVCEALALIEKPLSGRLNSA